MARNTNMKQEQRRSTTLKRQGQLVAFQKPRRKAPGTRVGILQDWRGNSNKAGTASVGVGKTIRDGR